MIRFNALQDLLMGLLLILLTAAPSVQAVEPKPASCATWLAGVGQNLREILQPSRVQEEIWGLYDQGRHEESAALEAKVRRELESGTYVRVGAAGGKSDADLLRFATGMQAVRKIRNNPELTLREAWLYEIDRRSGYKFHVPVSIMRGEDSVQLFVPHHEHVASPEGVWPGLPMELWILDMLTGNWDRGDAFNWLRTASGRFVAIDNERAEYLTKDLDFEKARITGGVAAQYLKLHPELKVNPLLNIRLDDRDTTVQAPATLDALRRGLAKRGYDEAEFRAFVHSLDEQVFILVLKDKIAPEALELILATLKFFKEV